MPDYNFIMDSRLRPAQLRVVNQLGRLAASQGLNLYLVGSAARDVILGLTGARDLTFVVEGNVQKILKLLTARAGQRTGAARPPGSDGFDLRIESVTLDSKLNEAHVVFEGGVGAEIAMSHNEVYSSPGKAPAVSPGTIFDDLRRRDFSIDAMAISLHPNSRGLLLDPTNGAADIERKELRALHSRSFFDDPGRIYRLLRLSLRFDFKPDEKTERWLGMALEERVWEHLPEDHQGRELRAILSEEASGKLLKLLRDRDLLAGLDHRLASARIEFDKFERIRSAVRTASATDADALLLNFHAMVAKMPGADQNRLAKKILQDAKTIKTALSLERDAAQLAKVLGGPKTTKASQIHTLLSSSPQALALFLLVHDTRAAIQNRVKAFFTKYPGIRSALPRAELEALGLPPGPKFEKVMDQIFLDELDGKIKNPQQMTKLLMDYAGIKAPPPPVAAPTKAGTGKTAGPKTLVAKPAQSKPPASVEQPAAVAAPPAASPALKPDKSKAGKVPPIKAEPTRPTAGPVAAAAPAKTSKAVAVAKPAATAKVTKDVKAVAAKRSPQASAPPKTAKGRPQAPPKTGKSRPQAPPRPPKTKAASKSKPTKASPPARKSSGSAKAPRRR